MKHIGDELSEIVKPLDPVPIPTKYQGVEFRSRLEARWAVFMDSIGVRWFYEFEGYRLGDVWYLPDFYLPDLDCWLEIKPTAPSDDETRKASLLAKATKKRVFVAYGAPEIERVANGCWWDDSIEAHFPDGGWDNQYAFCFCPICREIGIEFNGRGRRVCKNEKCAREWTGHEDKGYTSDDYLFVKAAAKAMLARFW